VVLWAPPETDPRIGASVRVSTVFLEAVSRANLQELVPPDESEELARRGAFRNGNTFATSSLLDVVPLVLRQF